MVPQDVKDKATKDTVPVIDVTQFGYFKVLGKGFLPESYNFVIIFYAFDVFSGGKLGFCLSHDFVPKALFDPLICLVTWIDGLMMLIMLCCLKMLVYALIS
ncbi:hypothetical protein OIU77_017729, partial [Salix suchowensis]